MDNGLFTGIVYFDAKNAFGTVNHDILLDKLSIYGVLDIGVDSFRSICPTENRAFVWVVCALVWEK